MLRFLSYLIKPTDIAGPVQWITAVILIFSVHGCSVVGPSAISRGRADYNEAVTRTDDQQILMALVHHRYLESIGLMAVSSVTANFSVQADTGINIGFGPTKLASTAVAVQYRGVWFYIDETDRTTKEAFLLANWLWSSLIADAAGQHQAAPVLTVPASR